MFFLTIINKAGEIFLLHHALFSEFSLYRLQCYKINLPKFPVFSKLKRVVSSCYFIVKKCLPDKPYLKL